MIDANAKEIANGQGARSRPDDWRTAYLQRYYNPDNGFVNGTRLFHDLCRQSCLRGGRLLEAGAGGPNQTSDFLATIGEVHGVDIDPIVGTNPALASFHVVADDRYPFPDHSFDACVADYVIEHVEDPARHLREVRRVLKPGAPYIIRTPNRWHYVYIAAAMTPHVMHKRYSNRLRALPVGTHEPYPTFYRMNTAKAVRKLAREGWQVEVISPLEREPSYGMATPWLFYPFMGYERVVNSTEWLAAFRSTLHVVLRVGE